MTKKVERLFKMLKRKKLLNDRREYDKEDLQKAYPSLTKKEVNELYVKIQERKW